MDTIVVNRPKQDPFHLFLDAALKTVAYLRVSTRSQDLANQKLAILEFSQKRRFPIDQFIESRISSRKSPIERRIDEMLGMLQPGDRLLVSELSRLGRSLSQVIQIVETLVRRKIRFIAIKEAIEFDGKQDLRTKVMIALFGLFAEVERDLISERTKEGTCRCQSQGENCSAGPRGPWEHPGSTARSKTSGRCWARMSPRPPSPRYSTSPAPPSTTSSRPARSLQADPKARTALMFVFQQ